MRLLRVVAALSRRSRRRIPCMNCSHEELRRMRGPSPPPREFLRPREPEALYPAGVVSSPRPGDRDNPVRAPEAFCASDIEAACPDCASLRGESSRTSDTGEPTRRCGVFQVHRAWLWALGTAEVGRPAAPGRALLSAIPRSPVVAPPPACNGPEYVRERAAIAPALRAASPDSRSCP